MDSLNGSQVIKGSHLWDHARVPSFAEAARAEMDVGEAFIFLSSTVHAGGANETQRQRPVHGFFFCRSYIRPEESLFFQRQASGVMTC